MPRTLMSLALLSTALVVGGAWAQQPADVEDVLRALRAGGHVIVFRHGATHPDQADTDPLNLDNVGKQRQLNDKGRADAKAIGEVFRSARIAIGKSYSSRFHRAVETARLIGGKEPEATPDVLDAFGKDWFEIREGEASIFKPDGSGKYSLVGRVQIDQWSTAKR